MNFRETQNADARLVILKTLATEIDYSLNDNLLSVALEAYGHRRPREYVRDQLRWLEQMGAVTVLEAGTVLVGTITQRGRDHVEFRAVIEGIRRPSPEA